MISALIKNELIKSPYIKKIDFAIYTSEKILSSADFEFRKEKKTEGLFLEGENDLMKVKWNFVYEKKGISVSISIEKKEKISVSRIDNLVIEIDKVLIKGDMVIPHLGSSRFGFAGNKLISEMRPETDVRISGLFESIALKGFMIAELLPLKFLYKIRVIKNDDGIRFEPFTKFTESYSKESVIESQKTWIYEDCTIPEGMAALKAMLPVRKKYVPRAFGWNSWDYYFASVSHDDIMENLEFIKNDKVLSENIKYITIDDGWQHLWGEWVENHKFKNGMKYTADKIKEAGFIPGIWVAPIQIVPFCDVALWHSDMLLKGDDGDPYYGTTTNQYNIDPTHPDGKEFIKKIFTKLYNDGYRLFKIDFLCQFSSADDFKDNIQAKRFYDKNAGPYDALRELFRIIRECVTEESHIIGCSLPVECGADLVDSARISIDMHNWQSCTELVADSMEWAYIYHGTVWNNDVDFLIVRGSETSKDKVTTNCVAGRKDYRSGIPEKTKDFTYVQARTWTNLVMISGGNVFLSDKLTALNEKGLELLHTAVAYKSESPAVPVYLENELRASFWVSDDAALIINWSGEEKSFAISEDLIPFDTSSATDIHTKEKIRFTDGKLKLKLAPYDSLMIIK